MEKMDIRKQLGCIKSPIEDTDYLAVPYLADVLFAGPLPTKVDFVPEMTPIKNQGNEGACVGFATTAVKEWMELKDYNLTLDKYIDLSERYIYQAAKKENGQSPTSEGTTLKAAAAALVKRGICRESFWPYVAQKIGAPVPDAATADADAAIFQIDAKYTRITTVNELKAALVARPVSMMRKPWVPFSR